MGQYSAVKTQYAQLQRKTTGNLAVRSLVDVLKKEHFVLDSEYLTTLPVAVPKTSYKEWYAMYESLAQMVVPRSTQLVAEDDDYGLFTVTMFSKVVDEFTHKARENKFQVRDFKWNETQLAQDKKELAEVAGTEKELWSNLLRLSKTNFGEAFSCWIHIKALRVYVESVLRYGLPPDFQPMVVKPQGKSEKKCREVLDGQYQHLGGAAADGKGKKKKGEDADMNAESVQMLLGDKEFYPYVSFTILWDDGSKQ